MKKKPTTAGRSKEARPSPAKPSLRPLIDILPDAVPLKQLLKKTLPPAVPRIWPWLDSGESCLLWGGTGSGKSFVAMTLALGVAGGGSALGWEFRNPCRVLYIDGEQSERDLQDRFALLRSAIAGHDEAKGAENLITSGRTLSKPGAPYFDLNSPEKSGPFVEALKQGGIGFVVFDNLSTLSDSLSDENSAAEFKRMQALFAHLKAANIASVLVHHAGKNPGARYRGSSNIGTTFERIVALHHNEKEPSTVLAARAEIEKYRSKPPPGFSPQVHFRLISEEVDGVATTARWHIDEEQGQLAEAWRMFLAGGFESIAEFVGAYNRRFDTRKRAGNFSRDFRIPWERDLGIPALKIAQVRGWAEGSDGANRARSSDRY